MRTDRLYRAGPSLHTSCSGLVAVRRVALVLFPTNVVVVENHQYKYCLHPEPSHRYILIVRTPVMKVQMTVLSMRDVAAIPEAVPFIVASRKVMLL